MRRFPQGQAPGIGRNNMEPHLLSSGHRETADLGSQESETIKAKKETVNFYI